MISGQVPLSETSLTCVTVGFAVQLSATPVTEFTSIVGNSEIQAIVMSAGAVPVGAILSLIVIVCVTCIVNPHLSVIRYVLVIISGQVPLSETSLTCVTVGFAVQLSATPVTEFTSIAGNSEIQAIVISAGAVPVGAILSLIVIVCVA